MLRAQTIKKDKLFKPKIFIGLFFKILIADVCKKDGKIFTRASEIVFIKEYKVTSQL